jgi:hypothetical protein
MPTFKSYVSSLSHLESFFLFLDLFHAAVMELLKEKMPYRKLTTNLLMFFSNEIFSFLIVTEVYWKT